jgi:voltage-gated sodium channel
MHSVLKQAPWAWIYFILFILVGTFVILNLFVGVIVSKVGNGEQSEVDAHTKLTQEMDELKKEIMLLRKDLQQGTIPIHSSDSTIGHNQQSKNTVNITPKS